MSDTDPLLRAVSDGNPACPDGRALARLGELIRAHSQLPGDSDLAPLVRSRLDADDSVSIAPDPVDAVAIDLAWDGVRAAGSPAMDGDDSLARLGELIAGASSLPYPVDLADRVRQRLKNADRQPDMPQLEKGGRWRIWSAVISAHVAALVAIAIYQTAIHDRDQGGSADAVSITMMKGVRASDPGYTGPEMPTRLPMQWSEMHEVGTDLFLLRRFPELREEARRHYGMERSGAAVSGGLSWLESSQHADGSFGKLSGDGDRDLATQSLAALALLGEGLGDQKRTAAIRGSLAWIDAQLDDEHFHEHGQVPAGIACLALVEGGLLLADPALRAQAEDVLIELDRGVPVQPGAAGLGGFTLLALETACQGGMRVPPRLLEQGRRNLGRSLPTQEDDAGRLGLAAFSRLIYGYRGKTSTSRQLEVLGTLPPQPSAAGQVNPLGWFFATLALREAGDVAWDRWAASLQAALVPAFEATPDGGMRVPAAKVRYADGDGGDVFATSLAILNLQAAYRYLPLDSR